MRRELHGVLRDRFRLVTSPENSDKRYGKRPSPGETQTVSRVRTSWPIEIVTDSGETVSLEQALEDAKLWGREIRILIVAGEPLAPEDRPTDPDRGWPFSFD